MPILLKAVAFYTVIILISIWLYSHERSQVLAHFSGAGSLPAQPDDCLKAGNCPPHDLVIFAGQNSKSIRLFYKQCTWTEVIKRVGNTTAQFTEFYVQRPNRQWEWSRTTNGTQNFMRLHLEGDPGAYRLYAVHTKSGDCPSFVNQ
ncbi:MAG: hypothetical protein AB7U75_17270 [Hyphomicrobiaceae bacterium]